MIRVGNLQLMPVVDALSPRPEWAEGVGEVVFPDGSVWRLWLPSGFGPRRVFGGAVGLLREALIMAGAPLAIYAPVFATTAGKMAVVVVREEVG